MKIRIASLLTLLSGLAFIHSPALGMDDKSPPSYVPSRQRKILTEERRSLGEFLSLQNYPKAFISLRAELPSTVSDKDIISYLITSNSYKKSWGALDREDQIWVSSKIINKARKIELDDFISKQDYASAFNATRKIVREDLPDEEIVKYLLESNGYKKWTELSEANKIAVTKKITYEAQKLELKDLLSKQNYPEAFKPLRTTLPATVSNEQIAPEISDMLSQLPPDNPVVIPEQAQPKPVQFITALKLDKKDPYCPVKPYFMLTPSFKDPSTVVKRVHYVESDAEDFSRQLQATVPIQSENTFSFKAWLFEGELRVALTSIFYTNTFISKTYNHPGSIEDRLTYTSASRNEACLSFLSKRTSSDTKSKFRIDQLTLEKDASQEEKNIVVAEKASNTLIHPLTVESHTNDYQYQLESLVKLNKGDNTFSFEGDVEQGDVLVALVNNEKTTILASKPYTGVGVFKDTLTYQASSQEDAFLTFLSKNKSGENLSKFSVYAVSGASTVPAIASPPLLPINMRSQEQRPINWEHANGFDVIPDPFMDKLVLRVGASITDSDLTRNGPIQFGFLDGSNQIIKEEGASQVITQPGNYTVLLEVSLNGDPNPKLQFFNNPGVGRSSSLIGFFQFPLTSKTPYSPAIEIYLKDLSESGGFYLGGFLHPMTQCHYQNLEKIEIHSLIEKAMRENSPGVFGWKAAGLAYGRYGYTQDHPTLLAFIDEYVDRKDEGAIQWKANALFHNLFNIKGNSETFYAFLKDQAAKGSRVALGLQNETQKGIYYKGRAGHKICYGNNLRNYIRVKFHPQPDDQGIHEAVSNLLKLDSSIKEEEKSSAMDVNCAFGADALPVISRELIEKEVQEGNRMALYLKAKYMLTNDRKIAFIRFYQLIFPCTHSREHRIGWFYDESMAP